MRNKDFIKSKLFPCNVLAEQVVLAILLKHPSSINFISQVLPIEAFFLQKHQIIYQTTLILNKNEQIIDLVTIATWLQDNNLINLIGGLKTLIILSEKTVSLINLKQYAQLLKEKYNRRLLIKLGKEIIKLSFQTSLSVSSIIDKIYKEIYLFSTKENYNNLSRTSEVLTDLFYNFEKKSLFGGYSSQFFDLDAITQGFQKSDLIIIAGRPSIGKTAFSLNIAINICSSYNLPVIFFSLEMTKQQLVYRILAIKTGINSSCLKLKNLTQNEWGKVNLALKELSCLPFYIDDTSNISLTEIQLKIQKIKFQYNSVALIVFDYLQLIQNNNKSENRVQEISQITRNLKKFAKEFDVPIIVLSQLSRNVESRNNKRPILSDLRESGCIHLKQTQFFNYQNNKYFYNIFSLSKIQIKNYSYFNCQFTGFKPSFIIQTKCNFYILTSFNHKLLNEKLFEKLINFSNNLFIKTNLSIFFNTILYSSIFNEKIKKIKYKGLKAVYDLELSKNKNFLKNGFILHNSIEQDADIVLMLYSKNYYEKEVNLNESIIEVIVSKNRNGPIGIVKLFFNGSLTKFFNYD